MVDIRKENSCTTNEIDQTREIRLKERGRNYGQGKVRQDTRYGQTQDGMGPSKARQNMKKDKTGRDKRKETRRCRTTQDRSKHQID